MLEDLWNSFLDLTSQFVIPDWGALISLLPVFLLIVIVAWLILLVRRFATAGPTRRGKRRITPVAPAGLHMPGPSFAPIIVAVGAMVLFWGLVVGGAALLVGIVALVLALLVWGAEGLRDYDHLGDSAAERLPEPVHAGPPPGVHMPGPSFRPILGALGVAVLFFGLVFGGWLLAVGVILLIWTLLGWLIDARKEYVKTVEADRTGHLENIDPPRWPRRVLWVGALLVALAFLADNGIFPPRPDAAVGGEPTTPGEEGPAQSGPPGGQSEGPEIIGQNIAFEPKELTVGADEPFEIRFVNRDPAGVLHDVDIRNAAGETLQDQQTIDGGAETTYRFEALPAGQYTFICSIHPIPGMTGTLTVE